MWLFTCWSIKILRNLFLFNYLALVHHVEKTTLRQNLIFVYTNSPVNFHKHITIHTSGNIHHQQTRPSVLIITISNLSPKFIKFPTNIISLSLRYIFFFIILQFSTHTNWEILHSKLILIWMNWIPLQNNNKVIFKF